MRVENTKFLLLPLIISLSVCLYLHVLKHFFDFVYIFNVHHQTYILKLVW